MPNITLYLSDDEYFEFKQLNEEQQKEARDNAAKQILKIVRESKKGDKNDIS